MTTQSVITTQPQQVIIVQKGQWQTDLFDCFGDMGVCLYGLCCPNCLGCEVAGAMNECCLCGPSMALRAVYRTKYHIPGSLCKDALITTFFPLCSLCQLQRDIKRRKELGIF